MSASKVSPEDFLLAETVVGHLAGNYEASIQPQADSMTTPDAVKHFTERQALMFVQNS